MQSEHVSDPAEPGLRSATRGGSTLFQKGGPNIGRQNFVLHPGGGLVFPSLRLHDTLKKVARSCNHDHD